MPNYLEPFVVRVPGNFETRLHNVDARLEIVATVRFPSLEHVAALQRVGPDLTAAMAAVIDTIVRERMHSIHPGRFYMRFSYTDEERETQSVEAELTQLITKR